MFADMSPAKTMLLVIAVGALAIVTLALVFATWYCVSYYNQLLEDDVRVKANWSDVLNQYRRRFDLLPNVITVVQNYATHETALFKEITESRAKLADLDVALSKGQDGKAASQFLAAQQQLTGQLARLLTVANGYPELKASQMSQELIIQLEGSENRISFARQRYIGAVANYNLNVRRFPGNIIASSAGLQPKPDLVMGDESALAAVPAVSAK